MIYLDTHIVVWFHAGYTKRFLQPIVDLMNTHDWLISPIVRLELQYLHEIGRIDPEADIIIAELGKQVGLSVCTKPFNGVIAQAMQLTWTRDPFDRILVAHAGVDSNILISSDEHISENYEFTHWKSS